MADPGLHRVNVRAKPAFLRRLMLELAGNNNMSVEGDLSHYGFTDDLMLIRADTAVLKRHTICLRQDFVVLRLTPETVGPIYKQVMAAGLKCAIIHVQIGRNGVLELGAYDHFHQDCSTTGPGVSAALLDELKSANVLRDIKTLTNF